MAAFNPVMSMAPIVVEAPRPAMRRKSSAQNLLSGFKAAANPAAGGAPPSSFPATSGVSTPGLPYPTVVPTPTTATMPREWDVQSLHRDGVNSAQLQTNGNIPQGTSVEFLRELVKKRIITLTYLRNVHEGCVAYVPPRYETPVNRTPRIHAPLRRSHWFHTIMVTRAELDRAFSNAAMKQR